MTTLMNAFDGRSLIGTVLRGQLAGMPLSNLFDLSQMMFSLDARASLIANAQEIVAGLPADIFLDLPAEVDLAELGIAADNEGVDTSAFEGLALTVVSLTAAVHALLPKPETRQELTKSYGSSLRACCGIRDGLRSRPRTNQARRRLRRALSDSSYG